MHILACAHTDALEKKINQIRNWFGLSSRERKITAQKKLKQSRFNRQYDQLAIAVHFVVML